jgi:hypothetical protein
MNVFRLAGIPLELCIEETMANLVLVLTQGYGNTPYHCATHAADVVQSTYVLLDMCGVWECLTPLERLSVIFAAAAHDYGHPGRNNAYLTSTFDEVAFDFNDRSVLENYHLKSAFMLLRAPALDITQRMDNDQYRTFRKLVINMILSTDMATHMDLLNAFRQKKLSPELVLTNEDNKALFLRVCIHTADVSNPTKPLTTYLEWTRRVMEEFALQGVDELNVGLVCSPFCDAGASVSKCQLGFIKFVVRPMFEVLSEFSEESYALMLSYLTKNQTHWAEQSI